MATRQLQSTRFQNSCWQAFKEIVNYNELASIDKQEIERILTDITVNLDQYKEQVRGICKTEQEYFHLMQRTEQIIKEKNTKDTQSTQQSQKSQRQASNKDEEEVRTSFLEHQNIIFEQTSGGHYIAADGKTYQEIILNGIPHRPIRGEEIEKKIVLLPTGLQEYGTIQDLIADLEHHINNYYDCTEETRRFCAWYILLTWVYDRLNTINYLRAMGDWGTGKSRFFDVVGRLCYKSIIGSGAGSVAALKRMVNKWQGTVLSDEGDFKDTDERGELVKFFNLGFERNRAIYQCNKNDPDKIEFYLPYCPKVITTRKPFADHALESRCLTHQTQTTRRQDIPVILPKRFYVEEEALRNKLLKFRFDYYYKIDADEALTIDLGGIEMRLKQAMISFCSLFANIPDMLENFKVFLQEYQSRLKDERAGSYDGQIVNSIASLAISGNLEITPRMIADSLSEEGFNANARSIGRHLKGLGLSVSIRKVGGKTQRVLEFDDAFIRAVERYVPDKDTVTMVTCVTIDTLRCARTQTLSLYQDNKKWPVTCNQCNKRDNVTENVEEEPLVEIPENQVSTGNEVSKNGQKTGVSSNTFDDEGSHLNDTKACAVCGAHYPHLESVSGRLLCADCYLDFKKSLEDVRNHEKKEIINLICHYCGHTPCSAWDARGRPVCLACSENPNVKMPEG